MIKGALILTLLAVGSAMVTSSLYRKEKSPEDLANRSDAKMKLLYQKWRIKHNGLMGPTESPAELNYRIQVFTDNFKLIQQRNSQYEQAMIEKFGVQKARQLMTGPAFVLTESADLTSEEYLAVHAGLRASEVPTGLMTGDGGLQQRTSLSQEPERPGFEIIPRSQGACASCWAFTAVAIAEKFYFQQTGKQLKLSIQELVDCDKASNGCLGGWPILGLQYINSKDVTTEAMSPYQCDEGVCSTSSKKARSGLKGLLNPTTVPFSLDTVRKATEQGYYVGTGINAGGDLRFINSSDDVFYAMGDDCTKGINHAVTLIEASNEWVRILNSAGPNWGYKGTKRIAPCTSTTLLGNVGSLYLPKPL